MGALSLGRLGGVFTELLAGRAASPRQQDVNAEQDTMLAYFLSTLDVRVRRIPRSVSADEAKSGILSEIQGSLKSFRANFPMVAGGQNDPAWNEAYRIERLIALIEPPEDLWPELKQRVAEAAEEKLPASQRLAAAADAAYPLVFDTQNPMTLRAGGEAILRSLLLDTLEEIHWAAQRKFYSRPIRRSATTRIVWSGMIAFVLFILPYIVLYASLELGKTNPLEAWSWLPLYTALTSGLFGALFSRLLYLQSNWDSLTIGGLRAAREFTSILLRGCVGMTGAVIVSFFLQSNVIGGGLFPKFEEIGLEYAHYPIAKANEVVTTSLQLIYPSKSLALLVVWSFLAGFSERLVPSILQDTETSIGKGVSGK
jgi:hypothetical protein